MDSQAVGVQLLVEAFSIQTASGKHASLHSKGAMGQCGRGVTLTTTSTNWKGYEWVQLNILHGIMLN
jgi:hypothetical protein